MLERGDRISARGALKHLQDVRSPSSLTRDPVRRAMVEEFRQRQAEGLAWTRRARKEPVARLDALLAERDRTIAELQHQVQLLVASHKALVHAVGELGGLPAWKKAFEQYEHCLDELRRLNATSERVERRPAAPLAGGQSLS